MYILNVVHREDPAYSCYSTGMGKEMALSMQKFVQFRSGKSAWTGRAKQEILLSEKLPLVSFDTQWES
jgi:hypothetical protein